MVVFAGNGKVVEKFVVFNTYATGSSTKTRSLSDLGNQSENSTGRGKILSILKVNSRSIDQESGEIWTAQADLQPISFKSDRLLGGWDPARASRRRVRRAAQRAAGFPGAAP